MAAKKKTNAIPELKKLQAAAKDINEVIEPEKKLPEKGKLSKEKLAEKIKEVAEIIYETDPLKKTTLDVLEQLGIIPLPAPEEEEEEEDEVEETEDEEDEDEEVEDEEDEDEDEDEDEEDEEDEDEVEEDEDEDEETPPAPKKKPAPRSRKYDPAEQRAHLASLIEKGKFTIKELTEKMLKKFEGGWSAATIQTAIRDGKNPKYNKFDRLVQIEDSIVSFAKKGKKKTSSTSKKTKKK